MLTADDARSLLARFAGRPMIEAYHDLADEYEAEDGFEPTPIEDVVDIAEGDLREALEVLGFDPDMEADDRLPDLEGLHHDD